MHRRTLLVSAAMLPLLHTPLRAAEPDNPLLGD